MADPLLLLVFKLLHLVYLIETFSNIILNSLKCLANSIIKEIHFQKKWLLHPFINIFAGSCIFSLRTVNPCGKRKWNIISLYTNTNTRKRAVVCINKLCILNKLLSTSCWCWLMLMMMIMLLLMILKCCVHRCVEHKLVAAPKYW